MTGHRWNRDYCHDFDMNDPEFNNNYDAIVSELIEKCPVARSESTGGYWVINRYDDVKRCAQDWQNFSSEKYGTMADDMTERASNVPAETDPPRHDYWRHLLNPYFSPKYIARYEEPIREIVDELIDQFVGDGECDIVPAFSAQFPGLVFFREVLSMPTSDVGMLRDTSKQAVHGPVEQRPAGWIALGEYVAAYLEDRRRSAPRGDVVDAVLNAEFADGPPPWEEKVRCVTTLMAGGLNTTSVAVAGGMHHFALSPGDRNRVLSDPQALTAAIEEILRLYNPVFAIKRTAMRDVEVSGQKIAEGERVWIGFGGACRDPAQFADPLVFNMDRGENTHVAFGLGPHRCIGSHLVRLDLRIAFTQLLSRLRNLRLVAEPVYVTSSLRELDSVRVAFDPVPAGTPA